MSNISYGVILIKKEKNENKILMINRKDSLCYIDFIRGKYKLNNLEYINKLFSRMSKEEIENIKTQEFSKLWKSLWNIKNNNYLTKKEYIISNNKFYKIKKKYNFNNIIGYNNSEWEIPKGKKNNIETNKLAACRELEEETNINPEDYKLIQNIIPLTETFVGENNIIYKNIYYFGICLDNSNIFINSKNKEQINEIKDVQFFTKEEAINKIRDYNTTKKDIILNTFDFIDNPNFEIK